MEVKELRELTGLNQQKFGDLYSIPKRTLQNWELGVNKCPTYFRLALERMVKEDFQALETEKEKLLKRLSEIEKLLSES